MKPTFAIVPRGRLKRLAHEYELTESLDPTGLCAAPAAGTRSNYFGILIPRRGTLPCRLLDAPLGTEMFWRLGFDITAAVSKMHHRGLVHKEKPGEQPRWNDPAHGLPPSAEFGLERNDSINVMGRIPLENTRLYGDLAQIHCAKHSYMDMSEVFPMLNG